ncbi:MAG: hypothetical protein WKF82_05355 [Nocardioidaceae bacterium]
MSFGGRNGGEAFEAFGGAARFAEPVEDIEAAGEQRGGARGVLLEEGSDSEISEATCVEPLVAEGVEASQRFGQQLPGAVRVTGGE